MDWEGGKCPAEGAWDIWGAGAHGAWGETEDSGIVHPGEGKAEADSGAMWHLADEGI